MKFFIPASDSDEQTENVYSSIRQHLSEELGATFDDRRIRSLHYTHDGIEYSAVVGEPHELNEECVIAILHEPQRQLYYVCTENRGVAKGMPILVGNNLVISVSDFE